MASIVARLQRGEQAVAVLEDVDRCAPVAFSLAYVSPVVPDCTPMVLPSRSSSACDLLVLGLDQQRLVGVEVGIA